MARSRGTLTAPCPKQGCGNIVEIDQAWTPGGVNDYGGFILRCTTCSTVFPLPVGRDVNDSDVRAGAELLDRWDEEIEGDKERALRAHGL